MDPDKDKQVFAFFLASEKDKIQEIEKGHILFQGDLHNYFLPSTLPRNLCAIYTVKERDNALVPPSATPDKGYYYYVNIGALIQHEQANCNSIGECINPYTSPKNIGCKEKNIQCPFVSTKGEIELNECNKKLAGDFVVGGCGCGGGAKCDDDGAILASGTDRKVEKEVFQSSYNFVDFCKKDKLTPKCNVLVPGEYKIKYGLICDGDGVWQACNTEKEKNSGQEGTSQVTKINDCRCVKDGDIFKWTGQCSPTGSSLSQPTLSKPADNGIVGLQPILEWTAVTGATNYKFYVRISSQMIDNPTFSFCSQANLGVPLSTSHGTTYFWSAKACSDSSCNACGSYATERSFRIENSATESTESDNRWSGSAGTTISTDSDSIVGTNSIKGSISGSNLNDRVQMTYDFQNPIAINNINFFSKADKVITLKVVLVDSQNKEVSTTIPRDVAFPSSPTLKSRTQFSGNANFDWNTITKIKFMEEGGAARNIWIDGLYFT